MKRLSVAVAVLACGFAASSPARADFTVIQFASGHCEIWHDSRDDPWGAGWRKIAIGLPTWWAASAAIDAAREQDVCP